eukprot:124580-Rhodomonas_salina.1
MRPPQFGRGQSKYPSTGERGYAGTRVRGGTRGHGIPDAAPGPPGTRVPGYPELRVARALSPQEQQHTIPDIVIPGYPCTRYVHTPQHVRSDGFPEWGLAY